MPKWTVEVTHAPTGEEMILGVEAETREQAESLARDRGFAVRDCYRPGGGFYKGVRVVAWVAFWGFGSQAVLGVFCLFGGAFATPGDRGIKAGLVTVGVFAALATLGWLITRAMTDALRTDPPPDPRRGFDVVAPADPAPPPPHN